MANDNVQKKIGKDRPPRVQIEYEVTTGDSIEKKELPFVLGVMGDFSGQPAEPLPGLKDRKFINIDGDNFDKVMKGMKPRVMFQVDNTLAKDGTTFGVQLNFNGMADFEPAQVANQIEPLRKLLEAREKLSDLRNKMYSSDKLIQLLDDVLQNTDKLKALAAETGKQPGSTDKGSN